MARRIRDAQTNFIAGEFSPRLNARSDVKRYRNGAAALRNWMPRALGGVSTRPGFIYRATLAQSPAIIRPFTFSQSQLYWFVFSDTKLHVYSMTGSLLTTLTGAPWTAAMLTRLKWTRFGDTLFLTHPDMAMQVITRTGASSFARTAYAFETASGGFPVYEPYYKFAATGTTLTPSGTTGSVTLTASAASFTANHVGTRLRYKKKTCTVTAYTSPTEVTATVNETLPATTAETDWDEAVFSAAHGYANCVAFFDNRLIFGGSRDRPTGFWATKIAAYYNFDLGTAQANEAIWETLNNPTVSEIRAISAGRRLLVHTDSTLELVPTSDASPLTPADFPGFREQAPYGVNLVDPVQFDGACVYCQFTGAVVREAIWVDTAQALDSNPLSLLAEHLVADPVDMAALPGQTARPEQLLFLVNGDGNLSLLHSIRAEEVTAWLPWQTEGSFKSIAVAGEHVGALVEREIGGVTVWTLETLSDDTVLDCQKSATAGSPTRTFAAAFPHLAGATVHVMTNGHWLGEYDVDGAGGVVLDALDPEVTEIEAGFFVAPLLTPMPADYDLPEGAARGLMKRLVRALIQVDDSQTFQVQGRDVLPAFAGDDYAAAPPRTTGQIERRLLGVSREAQFDIEQTQPGRVTILGLTREVSLNG